MKKGLLFILLAAASVCLPAQEKENAAKSYTVETNRFGANWFISGGIGAQMYFGDNDGKADFGKRLAPALDIAVGKWFTPGIGLRLAYNGLQAKGAAPSADAMYAKGGTYSNGYYKQKWNMANFHGDVLFNLSNMLCGYNEDRIYSFIPYVGAGLAVSWSEPREKNLGINAGLINRFRVSSAVDINLELSATGLEGKFDGEHGGKHDYDGILGASIGLTYHFPQRGFQRPYPQMISELELRNMRQQMNEMAAANLELQQQLMDAESQPTTEVVEQQTVVVDADIIPRTVFFNIGSAEITPREAMNLSYLADHMKKFPNTSYVVNGYADSATGTPGLNKELSMKRAQAIVNVLVKQYGISANRLTVDANGGVDKFGQPILNRVVLVESNK